MEDLSSLRVRFADLTRLRAEYEDAGKRHLLGYLDHLIADAGAGIALLDRRAAIGAHDRAFLCPRDGCGR